jgi:hypothetical protein
MIFILNIYTPSLHEEQCGFTQNIIQPYGTHQEPHAAWKPNFVRPWNKLQLFIYKIEIACVYVYVCIFVYSSRTDILICTILGMLIS